MLHTRRPVPNVHYLRAIRYELSLTMSLIILPFPLIDVAIHILQHAISIGTIIQPVSSELITILIEKLSSAGLLSLHPVTHILIAASKSDGPMTVREVVLPLAFVLLSVHIVQGSIAFFHVGVVFAIIAVAVGVDEYSFAVHAATDPGAVVHGSISIPVAPPAMHATLHPLALVLLLHAAVAIAVHHGTLSVTLIVSPFTVELVTIAVKVNSISMTLAILPVTSVLVARGDEQCSSAVYSPILPLSLVSVSIRVVANSLTINTVVLPSTLKLRSIEVNVNAFAMSFASIPLSFIRLAIVVHELSNPVHLAVADLPLVLHCVDIVCFKDKLF
mmetsp:Transcript_13562/g.22317  ORF Transcript_13562/g.22317 Transcript_13562/m.22317 type:complete len:331 (+) Transcript_13562:488-1480(+)